LLGYRRPSARPRGRAAGFAASLLRWPVMLALTALWVAAGVLLWQPVPLVLSPAARLLALVAGTLLYFPGIALYLWGYRALGDMFGLSSGFGAALYQGHRLIERGPYRIVRHPMHLGVILAAWGALLIFWTRAMLLFAPAVLGVVVRARREDQLLVREFGAAWQEYRERVPGWIPRLRAPPP
ncbi:MAG: isoprenylcysteine carboxylmethyltransferase family protein, partial [Chloroflexi bacterium]|nr:isoprenylcysteine carboxylmethyltransferase family protein [Chloroflexota bacterium]